MRLLQYDYIIVGQGLAGSVLAYILLERNYKVLVIDQPKENSSSNVAAGLVNPITGRRVVKSWLADELLPFANNFYRELEIKFNSKFYFRKDIIEIIHNNQDLNEWSRRSAEETIKNYFIKNIDERNYEGKLKPFRKIFRIGGSAWMNIPAFLKIFRNHLKENSAILEEKFDYNLLKVHTDYVEYELIKATKIIFCEGFQSHENPFWSWIPLVPAKGEILTIKCKELPEEFIILSGIFLIPLGNHLFRIGSTYEWNFPHELPTSEGKLKLLKLLDDFLKIPYEIIDHRAGIRPTVKDRRPLIGSHSEHPNVLLFNGMGTKGVQLIPYFANHFADVLENKESLNPETDIKRFNKN